LVLVVLCGCSGGEPSLSSTSQNLAGTNGIGDNGLTTNGIANNGAWQNGAWQNGAWQNGAWQNGAWQNGAWQNGAWQNGAWQNGVYDNGAWQNGAWQNGAWQNAIWDGNLWAEAPVAHELIKTNPATAQVLQYLYSCSMPQGAHKTLDAGDGVIVMLDGAIGLWPTWAMAGSTCTGDCAATYDHWTSLMPDVKPDICDETCQRWLTACLLARTNAYGIKVDISMRAPDNAPQAIKDALAVVGDETTKYPLREGAFYGNMFATYPDATGVIMNTPHLDACAGPGSNIPDVTKRFCSSQGDDGPIDVIGVCEPRPDFPHGTCAGISGDEATGAMHDCYEKLDGQGTHYGEVITVYVKDPLAVCGNGICEATESRDGTCASDCRAGWARSFTTYLSARSLGNLTLPSIADPWFVTSSAVGGPNDQVVLAGQTNNPIDLGGTEPLLRICSPETMITTGAPPGVEVCNGLDDDMDTFIDEDSRSNAILAGYSADGANLWQKRIGASDTTIVMGVAYAPDGDIVVVATATPVFGGAWVARFASSGALRWGRFIGTNIEPDDSLAVDSAGNIYFAGNFRGTTTITGPGNTWTFTSPGPADGSSTIAEDAVVVKLSPAGDPLWAVQYGDENRDDPADLAVDANGNVVFGLMSDTLPKGLVFLDSATGAERWSKPGRHTGVAFDRDGNVFATGAYWNTSNAVYRDLYDFAPADARPFDFFVVKYDAEGHLLAQHGARRMCAKPCSAIIEGIDVFFDSAGNIVVGGQAMVLGDPGNGVDFGSGTFFTYGTADMFAASYNPADLSFRWSKHIPMVVDGTYRGMALDSHDRLVTSGAYSGSMLLDGRLLVNTIPEQRSFGNSFLASFHTPPAEDHEPPVMARFPNDIVVEATGPTGAQVWYMPPTAEDNGGAGAEVTCTPASSTTYSIGAHPVLCVATDPLGNHTPYDAAPQFTITVLDRIGPAITGVPEPIDVEATSSSGRVVTFDLPVAKDVVDGAREVTCDHASGSLFPIATTRVICRASDTRGNTTEVGFEVRVRDGVPPVVTVPATITATATSDAGAIVTYSASATDNIDGPLTPTCTPPSGSLFAAGTKVVSCSATDAAGNTATKTFEIHVVYPWSGFLQPINVDGSSLFKIGSTIPVKFSLSGITNATATLSLTKLSSSSVGTDLETTSTATADPGNAFRYDVTTDQYVFNLATKTLTAGTYQLRVDLNDGVARTVVISLKK
jgi:hypothetical protein